ncbi:MAG: inositol monophosphatase family protein [Pseudomonadota bacterium]|nr:inositol monophosphatase family protein [Pseudomonadota bacterium]
MSNFLKHSLKAAEESATIIKDYFKKIDYVYQKNENYRDLVSEVDNLSEQTILETLKTKFKDHNFLAEESGFENNGSNYTWVIDPLDGTVNYTRGIKMCAISLALKYKTQTILGIVYNPFSEELYYASDKKGAFLNGSKISVSNNNKVKDCLIIGGLSSDTSKNNSNQFSAFRKLNNKSLGVLRIGTAAYGLALLAKGSVDVFFGNGLKEWDVEAGIHIVKQAKGKVIYKKIGSNSVNLICANNKKILSEIQLII